MSQMASGFNDKSGLAGMVSGSRVSTAKQMSKLYVLQICKVRKLCYNVQFKPQRVTCCYFRVKQDHEDLQGRLDNQ